MTLDEIRTWALGHGFTAASSSTLVAPFQDAEVSLTFLRVAVLVKISNARGEHKIGTFRPGNGTIHVNEHGVLEGMGLSTSFLSAFVGPEGPKPVWMSDTYFYGNGPRPDADRGIGTPKY